MILLEHAHILPMTGREDEIKDGYVVVDGNQITYVGEKRHQGVFDEVIDCTHKVLMPALTNTHSHIPMTLLRGHGDELPLEQWLETRIYPAEDRLNDEVVYWGTLLGISEMLACGTGSYTDMYFFNDAIVRASIESGIKANVAKCLVCFDPEGKDDGGRYDEALDLYHRYHGAENGRIRIDMAFHAIYTTNPNYLRNTMQKMGDLDAIVQYHMSETITEHQGAKDKYGMTPAEIFAQCGVMDKPGVAAHFVQAEESDMQLLASKGIYVATCPSSNLKLGSGVPNIQKMMEQGVKVTIGTDGAASNNNLNMFEEMHLTAMLNKGYFRDPTAVGAYDVLHMATVNGAASQGRKDCGTIQVGSRADLILIDFDKPHLMPAPSVVSNLVYSAQASDVCMTMVDGKILYHNGEYTTIDMERVKFEAQKAAQYLTNY